MSVAAPTPAPWRRARRRPAAVLLAVLFLGAALVFLVSHLRPRGYTLRVTGGDSLGRRHALVRLLAEEANGQGVTLLLSDTGGSAEAMARIARGELDVALVQGNQPPAPGVRQVAALGVEPLHLLLKPELADAVRSRGLEALRGRRLNLSTRGSGTRSEAGDALAFAGLEPGRDFTDDDLPYAQLTALSYASLPDGLFMVSTLPSPVAEFLIRRHGYHLLPLPYGGAMALRNAAVVPAVIPAYAYSVSPAVPDRDLPTVGTRLLLVAGERVPPDAVRRLLAVTLESGFLRKANLPTPREPELLRAPEMPLHPGAQNYLNRNNPVLTASAVQSLESLRSFLVSVGLGLFFLWRYTSRRRYAGFDAYLARVTQIEKRALTLEMEAELDLRELLTIRNQLSGLKTEALEKFTAGELRGEELMTGFLTHVSDVRNYLTALILHERRRIAAYASDAIPDAEQSARFRAGWHDAVAGVPDADGETPEGGPGVPMNG